jgi:GNAT superfamily N-acetyltransferase
MSDTMTTLMRRGEYTITTDMNILDLEAIHDFLTHSYWSPGVPIEIVERAIANSLCFGLFHGQYQVGFARVITDKATFAYLADVYVLESHRGQGLSKWLLEVIQGHENLQGLRRFMLATRDAHGLYAQFGFAALANPSRMMEILNADAYHAPPLQEQQPP